MARERKQFQGPPVRARQRARLSEAMSAPGPEALVEALCEFSDSINELIQVGREQTALVQHLVENGSRYSEQADRNTERLIQSTEGLITALKEFSRE